MLSTNRYLKDVATGHIHEITLKMNHWSSYT